MLDLGRWCGEDSLTERTKLLEKFDLVDPGFASLEVWFEPDFASVESEVDWNFYLPEGSPQR